MFRKIIKGLKDVWCGTLEFDTEPKKDSFNPVTSGGVYDAINGAGGAKEIVYFDVDPSDPPSGIYEAIGESLSNNKIPVIRLDGAVYFYTATGTDKYVFVGGYTKEAVGYTEIEVSDDDSVTSKSVNDKVFNMYMLYRTDPASPGDPPGTGDQPGAGYWICDENKHVITKAELLAAHADGRYFILNNDIEPDSNTRKYFASVTVIQSTNVRILFCMTQTDDGSAAEFTEKLVSADSEGRLYILRSYEIYLAGTNQAVLVSEPQSFDSTQKAQGRDNIGAASASDVTALQSQVSSLSDVSAYTVKGEATVAQLNAGPSGIQAGWAYQLTDSGTLTAGSVAVVAGDTVAWDGTKWFPLVKSDYYATKTYAQNVASSIAPEFDPTRDYVVDESCTYEGTVYIFTSDHTAGAWNPAHATISGQNALLRLTAQNAMENNALLQRAAQNTIDVLNDQPEAEESKNGYYNNNGVFTSTEGLRCYKFEVEPNTNYIIYSSMFGSMSVCEFDENDNFIQGHKKSTEGTTHYTNVSFRTNYNCAYIWISTDPAFIERPSIIKDEADTKASGNSLAISKLENVFCVTKNPLDMQYGYYSSNGNFTANDGFKCYKVAVQPKRKYVYFGRKLGTMAIIELNSKNEQSTYYYVSGTVNTQVFVTSEQAAYVLVATQITSDVTEPALYLVENQESEFLNFMSREFTELQESSSQTGYYNTSGTYVSSTNSICSKFLVSPGNKYRAVADMFSAMAVCEFDENDNFIRSHRRRVYEPTQYYYFVDFVVAPNCAYVQVGSWSPYYPRLYNLGMNKAPIPKVFYGVAGLQKNIYNDRFGLGNYGRVDLVPGDSVSEGDYTRIYNRLELNVSTAKEIPFDIFASIDGESVYGNENLVKETAKVHFTARKNPSTAKNILWVGDSISDYKNTAKYVNAEFNATEGGVVPTFIGSRHLTGTPDEAYGGKGIYWLMTSAESPFVFNGVVDFAAYNTSKGVAAIDVCVMQMGFNDATDIVTAQNANNITVIINLYEQFIQKITEANPGIKIVWTLCPVESKYGRNKQSLLHDEACIRLRNEVLKLSEKYSNVMASDAFYCIDSVHGYPLEEIPIASVYSSLSLTEEYCSDSTHPTELGCKEWALSVYAAILSLWE